MNLQKKRTHAKIHSIGQKHPYLFRAWCPLKGHTYLNYVWHFSEHQALKGYDKLEVADLKYDNNFLNLKPKII